MSNSPGFSISFFIPGEPVPKARARSFIKNENGEIGHFTPKKTERYETLVALFGRQAMAGRPPTRDPVSLDLMIYVSIPESWSVKKKEAARLGNAVPTKRPDLDNFIKSLSDGLNKVVWCDDCQIVDCTAKKRFSEKPGVYVSAYSLESKCF